VFYNILDFVIGSFLLYHIFFDLSNGVLEVEFLCV
jgi:hypothetical protein